MGARQTRTTRTIWCRAFPGNTGVSPAGRNGPRLPVRIPIPGLGVPPVWEAENQQQGNAGEAPAFRGELAFSPLIRRSRARLPGHEFLRRFPGFARRVYGLPNPGGALRISTGTGASAGSNPNTRA